MSVNLSAENKAYKPTLTDVFDVEETSKNGALVIDAKYIGRFSESADKFAQARRKKTYQMQRRAAWLLPDERVSNCRWTVQRIDKPVELTRHAEGYASYAGLQTCGSVWSCPVCARRVSEQRRAEMNHVLQWARSEKFSVKMMTLTSRHTKNDSLDDQLASMKAALTKLRQRRDWKGIKKDYLVGNIVATEVTHGQAGWHVHFHIILILGNDDDGDAISPARLKKLSNAWLSSLRAVGLDGVAKHAFRIDSADAVGEYITKWGAAEEMVLSNEKKGRGGGRNPFQLLHDFTFERDKKAGQKFIEFSNVFKGARQLVYSNGLKKMAVVDEMNDEEAASDGEGDELVALINHVEWVGEMTADGDWLEDGERGVRTRRVRVLEAAERSPEEARRLIFSGPEDDEPDFACVVDETDFVVQENGTVKEDEHCEIQSEPSGKIMWQEQSYCEQRYQAGKDIRVERRQQIRDRCDGANSRIRIEGRTSDRLSSGNEGRSGDNTEYIEF